MPLPRWLARLNRHLANPLLRPLAERLPYFGVVHHRGRRSGRPYRTPVNVFIHRRFVVVALTYGRDVDWAKNVLAAGECGLVHRGRHVALAHPELLDSPGHLTVVPAWVRAILRMLRVRHYLRLEREGLQEAR